MNGRAEVQPGPVLGAAVVGGIRFHKSTGRGIYARSRTRSAEHAGAGHVNVQYHEECMRMTPTRLQVVQTLVALFEEPETRQWHFTLGVLYRSVECNWYVDMT